jgi:hypothetical protein
MFDVAIEHMLEILACGHQSKATQELFLRDFFQIVQVFLAAFTTSLFLTNFWQATTCSKSCLLDVFYQLILESVGA